MRARLIQRQNWIGDNDASGGPGRGKKTADDAAPEDGRTVLQRRNAVRGRGNGFRRRKDLLDLGIRIGVPDHIAPEPGAAKREGDGPLADRHAFHGAHVDAVQTGTGRLKPFEQ